MGTIYHIATKKDWEDAQHNGEYTATSLKTQGFIHCSTREQLIGVANFLFIGQNNLLLLTINSEKVKAIIRYENLTGKTEKFPHLYGALNLDAVVDATDFKPNAQGLFAFPK